MRDDQPKDYEEIEPELEDTTQIGCTGIIIGVVFGFVFWICILIIIYALVLLK